MSSIGTSNTNSILASSYQSATVNFEAFLSEQQNLAIKSATSGLQGLLDSLSETGVYNSLITSFSQSVQLVGEANEKALQDPFKAASQSQATTHQNYVDNSYDNLINGYESVLTSARSSAVSARDGTDADTAERTAGNSVISAADALITLRNSMDASTPNVSQAQTVLNQAQSARDAAYNAWNGLSAGERKNEALAVLNAANTILTQATNLKNLADSSLTRIQGETPTLHDLGGGFTLASWGDSGVLTLVGPDGKGILIKNDGTVDNIDGSGNGWKFNHTSTFVLPNETKITVSPGTPASVMITRGDHQFQITNLRNGQNPSTTAYGDGGRAADKGQNDGHIFYVSNTNSTSWSAGSNVLGDASSREVVATTAVNYKLKLDPTDVALPADGELLAFLTSIGYTLEDYDGDGKYNNLELFDACSVIQQIVAGLQEAFAKSLERIAQANSVLMELTMFLESIRAQGDKKQADKDQLTADERATLADIERRLVAAFEALKRENAQEGGSIQNDVTGGAEYVLNQLTQFNQQGTVTPGSLPPTLLPSYTSGSPSSNSAGSGSGSTSQTPLDSLGQALSRASRLLSGFGGPTYLEEPSSSTASNASTPGTLPPEVAALAQALQNLQQAFIQQGITNGTISTGELPPLPEISAGLQAFLNALAANPEVAALGLPPTQDGQYFMGLFSNLSYSTLSQEELNDLAPAMLGLVGYFAELAAFQDQNLPADVAGQPAAASSGSFAPESRFAESLRLVLQGLADLSTPGYSQSAPAQSQEPSTLPGTATPEQIREGLAKFLSVLATLGLFNTPIETPSAPGTPSSSVAGVLNFADNREQIKTITSNFLTDPELMKRLQENLNKAIQQHGEQMNLASNLFSQAQETVQNFVQLIKEDGLVKEIITSDDLSDDEQDKFADKMKDLQKEWGIDWGGPPSTPSEEANLVSKVVQSGMMV